MSDSLPDLNSEPLPEPPPDFVDNPMVPTMDEGVFSGGTGTPALAMPMPPAASAGPDLQKAPKRRKPSGGGAPSNVVGRIDRLPPHSIEAEQGVLGCILLSPNEAMGLCLEKIKSGAEAFYDLRHRPRQSGRSRVRLRGFRCDPPDAPCG